MVFVMQQMEEQRSALKGIKARASILLVLMVFVISVGFSYDRRPAVIVSVSGETVVAMGSWLELDCRVYHLSQETPRTISWYRGNLSNPIHGGVRGGIGIATDAESSTPVSQLIMLDMQMEDSGNYICTVDTPLLFISEYATVTVLDRKHGGRNAATENTDDALMIIVSLVVVILHLLVFC